jgi:hypothetical protein
MLAATPYRGVLTDSAVAGLGAIAGVTGSSAWPVDPRGWIGDQFGGIFLPGDFAVGSTAPRGGKSVSSGGGSLGLVAGDLHTFVFAAVDMSWVYKRGSGVRISSTGGLACDVPSLSMQLVRMAVRLHRACLGPVTSSVIV